MRHNKAMFLAWLEGATHSAKTRPLDAHRVGYIAAFFRDPQWQRATDNAWLIQATKLGISTTELLAFLRHHTAGKQLGKGAP